MIASQTADGILGGPLMHMPAWWDSLPVRQGAAACRRPAACIAPCLRRDAAFRRYKRVLVDSHLSTHPFTSPFPFFRRRYVQSAAVSPLMDHVLLGGGQDASQVGAGAWGGCVSLACDPAVNR